MKKNALFFVLIAPLLFLLSWVFFLNFQVGTSNQVVLPITGYDPRDLLSGRYLAYQIDWDKADCKQFENNVCPKEAFCAEARWGRQCRFYVPEVKANLLDRLFRNRQDTDTFEVIYAYKKDHQPLAKKLLINGKDWDLSSNLLQVKK